MGAETCDKFDVLANKSPDEILGGCDHVVEQHGAGLSSLLAGDCEQLLRQGRTMFSGQSNFFDVLAKTVTRGQTCREQIAIQKNAGEKVVEVVGDTARQSADHLHFFSFAKLLFDAAACGRVFKHRDEEDWLLSAVAHHRDVDMSPEVSTVLSAVALVQLEASAETSPEFDDQEFVLGEVIGVKLPGIHTGEFFVTVARHSRDRRIRLEYATVEAADADADGGGFEHGPETQLPVTNGSAKSAAFAFPQDRHDEFTSDVAKAVALDINKNLFSICAANSLLADQILARSF
jgi:hypothetical protein